MASELQEVPTERAGSSDGQQCFFLSKVISKCKACGVRTFCIQSGRETELCAKCFDDHAIRTGGWRCEEKGCMAARKVIERLQEIMKQSQADLSSSGEAPPITCGNPSAGSSSQVSHPKQPLQERMAELQEKVKGSQGQIDEVAVLKEQAKLMQEQIDEVPRLKEKIDFMQQQVDEFVDLFKRKQGQINKFSAQGSQQPWEKSQWSQAV